VVAEFAITGIRKQKICAILWRKIKMAGYSLADGPKALFFYKAAQNGKVRSKTELRALRKGWNKKSDAKKQYDGLFFQKIRLLCNDKKKITGYQFSK
jgi:hypothetical protein